MLCDVDVRCVVAYDGVLCCAVMYVHTAYGVLRAYMTVLCDNDALVSCAVVHVALCIVLR